VSASAGTQTVRRRRDPRSLELTEKGARNSSRARRDRNGKVMDLQNFEQGDLSNLARRYARLTGALFAQKQIKGKVAKVTRGARYLTLGVRLANPLTLDGALPLAEPLALACRTKAVLVQRSEADPGLVAFQFELAERFWRSFTRADVSGLGLDGGGPRRAGQGVAGAGHRSCDNRDRRQVGAAADRNAANCPSGLDAGAERQQRRTGSAFDAASNECLTLRPTWLSRCVTRGAFFEGGISGYLKTDFGATGARKGVNR